MIDLLLTIAIIILIVNPPFLTDEYLSVLENCCEDLVDEDTPFWSQYK